MRVALAMVLVCGLACGGFSATHYNRGIVAVSAQQFCTGSACTSTIPDNKWRIRLGTANVDDTFAVKVYDQGQYGDAQGTYCLSTANGAWNNMYYGSYSPQACRGAWEYEQNDCEHQYMGPNYYLYSVDLSTYYRCIVNRNTAINHTYGTCYHYLEGHFTMGMTYQIPNAYVNGHLRFTCGGRTLNGYGPRLYVSIITDNDSDKCDYSSNKACEVCSWPFAAVRDSIGCGCLVDHMHYQSQSALRARVGIYCNNYSDGSTYQYYLDESRSNFDASRGPITGACSCPTNGKTHYMALQGCPKGSAAPPGGLDSTLIGDSVQSASGTAVGTGGVGGSGVGAGYDTSVSSKLDTIIGLLRNGGSGSSGVDSGVYSRLDSGLSLLSTPLLASDTAGLGSGAIAAEHSIDSAADMYESAHDSLVSPFALPSRSCYSCDVPQPDTFPLQFSAFGYGLVDTFVVSDYRAIEERVPLFSLLRTIEWVFVTIAAAFLFVRIASGISEDQ